MASPVAVPADTHVGLATYTLFEEGILQGSILSQVLSFFDPTGGLPVAPVTGDRYISSATANGWTINTLQYWNGFEWIQVEPTSGELTYVVAGPTFPATAILWNGLAWSAFGGGAGDVLGPGAATDNAVVRWNGVTGTLVADSTVIISDVGGVTVPGPLQMPLAEPLNTTNVLNVTTVPGVPTGAPANAGSMIYDTAGQDLYIWNGATWDNFSPTALPTSESLSIAGGGNNPSLAVVTTFITTTAAASGTLNSPAAAAVGQLKYIVMSGYAGDYVMTVTNGIDAGGAAINTITYTSAGQGSTLTWDGTNWLILNAGGVVA